ncbi:exopolyphosphatase [Terasakiella brassicae]|uniref:Exopolyphosphatase n=1 Tax=Terasakiella brassicae TaxID=1634917 RepID=A0A917FDI0_9PROT|nr:exopolyphosphatase [Terasakiella brassicae]GGF64951.1 exopolyphosphatase [Terasakiella brassicae]
MTDQKYRLVTRADFDGVVSGTLLLELGMVDDIVFAEPKEIQDGQFTVSENDILTNLPYVEKAHLSLDHHFSEVERVGGHDNLVIDANAPSAARVVYNHFGGAQAFPKISTDMLAAVDKADAAQYNEEDILAPGPWVLLNFILDPRTGLDRVGKFAVSHEQFMKDMMVYCRHHPVEEILKIPDVEERLHLYSLHEEKFENQIKRNTVVHNNLVVFDLRKETESYAGNRFTIYALYPQCNISIQVIPEIEPGKCLLACGKSILDRSSKTNVGSLMLKYGGGGHKQVGTCRVENDQVDQVLSELVAQITADG